MFRNLDAWLRTPPRVQGLGQQGQQQALQSFVESSDNHVATAIRHQPASGGLGVHVRQQSAGRLVPELAR